MERNHSQKLSKLVQEMQELHEQRASETEKNKQLL